MKLSRRLETVASFVGKGSRVVDIGTDHGYIPIWLVETGRVETALAMDVSLGPLLRAAGHVRARGLEDRIKTRLSDGLKELKAGEADCVVMAGMGGELVIRILDQGRHAWEGIRRWILSPQSDLDQVRRYLEKEAFSITREAMVEEDGKYYTVMEAQPGAMAYGRETYYRYGKILIQEGSLVLKAYLEKRRRKLEAILQSLEGRQTQKAAMGRAQIQQELLWIKEAEDEMQQGDRKAGEAGAYSLRL